MTPAQHRIITLALDLDTCFAIAHHMLACALDLSHHTAALQAVAAGLSCRAVLLPSAQLCSTPYLVGGNHSDMPYHLQQLQHQ